jgi:hypothetical protein
MKFWILSLLEPFGPVRGLNGIASPFTTLLHHELPDWSNDPIFLHRFACLFLKVIVLANWILISIFTLLLRGKNSLREGDVL